MMRQLIRLSLSSPSSPTPPVNLVPRCSVPFSVIMSFSSFIQRARSSSKTWRSSVSPLSSLTIGSPVSSFSTTTSNNQSKPQCILTPADFQRHGYKLANINPLETNGFLADTSTIDDSLPATMRPLVKLIAEHRQKQQDSINSMTFAKAVAADWKKLCSSTTKGLEDVDLEWSIHKYCGTGIGFEFDHCYSEAERLFFTDLQPEESSPKQDGDLLLWAYEQLLRGVHFGEFMSGRYSTARRFGIEGIEAAVPALNAIVNAFGDYDTSQIRSSSSSDSAPLRQKTKRLVLGTQHRGRLDFLANVLEIPLEELVNRWDITDGPSYDDICCGYHRDVATRSGNNVVHISMLPIPAHLEAMGAVVSGKSRAHAVAQRLHRTSADNDGSSTQWDEALARRRVLPVTVHGDSSVCGQGIVSECLQLGTFEHYDCGGTIRLVLNNQIGFTTEVALIRNRSKHGMAQVSDLAKSAGAPVLHVNARLVPDVVRSATIAVDYRQRFGKDVFLNLWGWREHGHNELDDPHPTNVRLYQKIESQPSIIDQFRGLNDDGHPAQGSVFDNVEARVEQEYSKAKAIPRRPSWKASSTSLSSDGAVKHSLRPKRIISRTSVDQQLLDKAASRLTRIPEGFQMHHLVERVVESRKHALSDDSRRGKIDWATAELLALTTLDQQGIYCRLSGEDVQRGTFFQRHAVWHDVENGNEHHPLAPVEICNSPLSELGVIGFDYGFSVARPADSLVLWEAQFGDFVNGAQPILDAVLSSSDEKWGMQSGLTLLLPHGYDGMGPEHSSARLERWLQLFSSHLNIPSSSPLHQAGEDEEELHKYESANMIITYPSEPSNYFHLLRRQLTWSFRRPLVVLTPKRTLRMAAASSVVAQFLHPDNEESAITSMFQPVLDDPRMTTNSPSCSRDGIWGILLCSGELYYDLMSVLCSDDQKEARLSEKVAIVRLEEVAPFPVRELCRIIAQYKHARSVVWAQEEPANQGARDFVLKHLRNIPELKETIGAMTVTAFSRPEAASPAVGTPHGHHASQKKLFSDIVHWSEKVCSS